MTRNKFGLFFFLPMLVLSLISCDDDVTYSDMKNKERDAVKKFIKEKNINVISYEKFIKNDTVTDPSKNEFVEIDGVYMQIVNNPKKTPGARKIGDGETRTLLIRYYEYNILEGDTVSINKYESEPDEMRVTNESGVYTATFTSGIMASIYGNFVPTGWLTPLNYLYFTFKQGNLAKVKLIVPHTKGTMNAATYVYPCLYEISFQGELMFDYDE